MKITSHTLLTLTLTLSLCPAVLSQAPGTGPGDDLDGDGIPNEIEARYMLDRANPDTDGDGALDPLELAVGTDPADASDFPEASKPGDPVQVNLLVYHDRQTRQLRFVAPVYWPEGIDPSRSVDLLVADRSGRISPAPLIAERDGEVTQVRVSVYQADVRDVELFRNQRLSTAAVVYAGGAGTAVAAEEATLIASGSNPIHFYKHPRVNRRSSRHSVNTYVQILVGGSRPDGVPGTACLMRAQQVEAGRTRTYEVVEAECDLGWDGACSSGCASFAGVQVLSLNPTALLPGGR